MNQNWARWILASCRVWFYARRQGIPLYMEAQSRDPNRVQDYAEFRLDGPQISEESKNCFYFFVEINIWVAAVKDDKDLDRLPKTIGIFTKAFTNAIPVFKYGDGIDDDGSYLGCLLLKTDGRDHLDIAYFGQLQPDTPLLSASVEGHYEMYLDGDS